MKFTTEIKLTLHGIMSRKGRSFLTILGIVIGVAGVITIIALGAGAQSLVLGQITKIGTDLISVQPGKSNEMGPPSFVFGIQITTLIREDADALRDKNRLPHLTAVMAAVQGSATVVWRDRNIDTNFLGTESTYPDLFSVGFDSGRYFTAEEDRTASNVVVLGKDVAEELFDQTEPLGQIVKIKNVPFKVIGVANRRGTTAFINWDDMVLLPIAIGQSQILGIKHVQVIDAKVDSLENVTATIEEVKQVMRERHKIKNPEDDDFTVRNLADAIKILTQVTDALRLFLVLMAGISLVVGGIGIMNIMLITVAERTREIGLRKALGAKQHTIRNQFLFESALLTVFGGLIGIIFGVLVSYLVAVAARFAGYDWAFIISPLSIVLAVGVSVLTGVIFGLYPAFKASKLDPIEALRYE